MQIVVLAGDELKEELLSPGIIGECEVIWINDPELFLDYPTADGFIDLLYRHDPDRLQILTKLAPAPVIINEVAETLQHLPGNFARINGWPTFLKRPVIEGTANIKVVIKEVEEIFSHFSKTIEWLPDVPGFISSRVIAMIINEAYFTFTEGVSSKEEIDTAMKLGTNYPYGPFEWGEKIGLQNVSSLLTQLGKEQPRYQPAPLLLKEIPT